MAWLQYYKNPWYVNKDFINEIDKELKYTNLYSKVDQMEMEELYTALKQT